MVAIYLAQQLAEIEPNRMRKLQVLEDIDAALSGFKTNKPGWMSFQLTSDIALK